MKLEITSMLNPDVYDHPVRNIELIETHISWVLLTGDFAYKIKKPVDFGFLDFSTLEKRRRCCQQELELNRRLAPELYLDVVPVTSVQNMPAISGLGEVVEYAVKMLQFPQSSQLDHMLEAGKLEAGHMEAIGHMVAQFHGTVQIADEEMDFGRKETVYHPVKENFKQINEHLDTDRYIHLLSELQQWSNAEFLKLGTVFEQRKRDGFIRECHGDMHLRNLVWLAGKPLAFDCIEFNSQLRWIDVISEVAFLIMDLQNRQQYQLANVYLNTYLETTGDYAGLSVLPFYLCYRALVRAKVDALRLAQKNATEEQREQILAEFSSYLELATTYTHQPVTRLVIMHGLSASGKSTLSRQLRDATGAIRIRSDVERKRLFGMTATDSASSEINTGIYTEQAANLTYAKLVELSSQIIKAGFSVIVDAAFLSYEQRKIFQTLAGELGVPYIILAVTAPAEILRQRISERKHNVSDADLAILDHQQLNWKPLHQKEADAAIAVNSTKPLRIEKLIDQIDAL